MNNKFLLLTAASAFSVAGMAVDYTNIVLINLDDVGYGDFSFNGAYGYTTPNIEKNWNFWQKNRDRRVCMRC